MKILVKRARNKKYEGKIFDVVSKHDRIEIDLGARKPKIVTCYKERIFDDAIKNVIGFKNPLEDNPKNICFRDLTKKGLSLVHFDQIEVIK